MAASATTRTQHRKRKSQSCIKRCARSVHLQIAANGALSKPHASSVSYNLVVDINQLKALVPARPAAPFVPSHDNCSCAHAGDFRMRITKFTLNALFPTRRDAWPA